MRRKSWHLNLKAPKKTVYGPTGNSLKHNITFKENFLKINENGFPETRSDSSCKMLLFSELFNNTGLQCNILHIREF